MELYYNENLMADWKCSEKSNVTFDWLLYQRETDEIKLYSQDKIET